MSFSFQKLFHWILSIAFCLGALSIAGRADDHQDDSNKTDYYWEGNQLNNLSRLSDSSPDFEKQEKHLQLGHTADQYLTTLRAQMSNQAAQHQKERIAMDYASGRPDNALEITYAGDGLQATLHSELLFEDNRADLKTGAMATLDRLRALIDQQSSQRPVHLLLSDRLNEDTPTRDLDAERTLVILSLIQLDQPTL